MTERESDRFCGWTFVFNKKRNSMPIVQNSTYNPSYLFKSKHLNTLYPALFRTSKGVDFQRIRYELPENDFFDADWSLQTAEPTTHRLLICIHGLEGNARRPYMVGMMRRFNKEGIDAVGLNLRGCSGEPNRLLAGYHSGHTADLDFLINTILRDKKYTDITLLGFSVGGNIALKYGGEKSDLMSPTIKRIIAFSVPCDLKNCSMELEKPNNWFYQWQFLVTLKQKARIQNARFPNQFDLDKVLTAKYFRQFDDYYTAPVNGFRDAEDYWAQASSAPHLSNIKVPSLLITALDDSFLADTCYPTDFAASSALFHLETPKYGGHLGFMSPDTEGVLWSEKRAIEFYQQT
jgi:uncharacterized protein